MTPSTQYTVRRWFGVSLVGLLAAACDAGGDQVPLDPESGLPVGLALRSGPEVSGTFSEDGLTIAFETITTEGGVALRYFDATGWSLVEEIEGNAVPAAWDVDPGPRPPAEQADHEALRALLAPAAAALAAVETDGDEATHLGRLVDLAERSVSEKPLPLASTTKLFVFDKTCSWSEFGSFGIRNNSYAVSNHYVRAWETLDSRYLLADGYVAPRATRYHTWGTSLLYRVTVTYDGNMTVWKNGNWCG